MKLRHLLALGGGVLGAVGAGIALTSFLPQKFVTERVDNTIKKAYISERVKLPGFTRIAELPDIPEVAKFPDIEVTFLRCGSVVLPEFLAVRGAFSAAPHRISHSAVLIRHPKGTFLYDSGLCSDIEFFLLGQSWFFFQTRGKFRMEQPIRDHLQRLNMRPKDLAFVLLSHLHWDHVAGIPDLHGVPLCINELEFDAANQGLLDRDNRLVRHLLSDNPLTLFNLTGPAYEGFRSSYDLFGDGSIVIVPLPGHTAGHVGMFINRAHGSRLFLIGDAAWSADNYTRPATMHPFLWSLVTSDDATARQTLIELHHFSQQHPEVPLIAMHDAQMQTAFMQVEQARLRVHK
jgi:glyoxylase-like metal-dependent hydrolase (beta-lactamase superfamily II)